jgi:hypothetical protein
MTSEGDLWYLEAVKIWKSRRPSWTVYTVSATC